MPDDTTAKHFTVERASNTCFEHHEFLEAEGEEIGEPAEREKHFSKRPAGRPMPKTNCG